MSTKDRCPLPSNLCSATRDQEQSILLPKVRMSAESETKRGAEIVILSCEANSKNNAREASSTLTSWKSLCVSMT